MLDDNELEEVAAYGAKHFVPGQTTDQFIALIQEKWQHASKYTLNGIFKGIRAHSDLIRADMMKGV